MIPGNDSTPFSLASFQLSSFSSLLCWTLYFQVIGSELVGHLFGSGECGQAVGVSETMSYLSVPLFSNNPTLQALSFHQMALRPCTQYGLLLFSSIAKVLTYEPEYLGRIFSSSASSSAKAPLILCAPASFRDFLPERFLAPASLQFALYSPII